MAEWLNGIAYYIVFLCNRGFKKVLGWNQIEGKILGVLHRSVFFSPYLSPSLNIYTVQPST
jgi:hypothetical protein